jgi:alpha-mannosidase
LRHQIRQTARKIRQRLALIEPLVHRFSHPLPPLRYLPLGANTDIPDVTQDDSAWQVITPGMYWGGKTINFLLSTHFSVPTGWDRPALHLPIGIAEDFLHPEALAYIDGAPYAAIDRFHSEIALPDSLRDGQSHRLVLHGWTGLMGSVQADPNKRLFMGSPAVVHIDHALREFIAAARTALEVAQYLDENHPTKDRLLNALDAAFITLHTREPLGDDFYASVSAAMQTLKNGIAEAGAPLDVQIIAAGHAHIDTAWMWTLGQTRRKVGRTFYNMLRFMDSEPTFHFSQSQPQLYDYARQDYPELFEAIKARVAEGRWEPLGGMWVEADCNISGGESLVRQLVLGRRFFRTHFGEHAESPVLWLPDVFGYAWNLPQLIKGAGLEYFFTIKIGWNQFNKPPYDSFWWQGLDGTKVLTHFSTSPEAFDIRAQPTYNAELNGMTALGTWYNLKHKAEQRVVLMSYGWGDGGGGPDRTMLENARHLAHFPGAPRITQGRVIDFFRRLDTESGAQLPTWNGELYLEIHRGTYTTQARNKRANRKSEMLLHDAEFLATAAALLDPDYSYPHDQFNRAWETVCLNQFHDIIPGSSIHEVYVESQAQYNQLQEQVVLLRDDALAVIARHMGGDLLAVNPTSFTKRGVTAAALPNGAHVYNQHDIPLSEQKNDASAALLDVYLQPYSIAAYRVGTGDAPVYAEPIDAAPTHLDNGIVRVEIDRNGDITRIYDHLNQRELLPPGMIANQWQAFEDRPLNWDAWDFDIFFEDKSWGAEPAESITVVEAGSLRAVVEIRRRILNSPYIQRIILTKDSARIDFETWIDWRERHILLKAAFPVDILSPVATYEIQFGQVQRPTHRNTSWDWARFETCAQKWIDLSEANFGVSLLNDCKYGHDVRDNVMRITLLRSPAHPDKDADAGEHYFTYSLMPRVNLEQTIAEAYHLNDPMFALPSIGGSVTQPEFTLLAPDMVGGLHFVIETVKWADDGQGFIVRLYEPLRQRGAAALKVGVPLKEAHICNLLEENKEALSVEEGEDGGSRLVFPIKPFQILTLRLIPA